MSLLVGPWEVEVHNLGGPQEAEVHNLVEEAHNLVVLLHNLVDVCCLVVVVGMQLVSDIQEQMEMELSSHISLEEGILQDYLGMEEEERYSSYCYQMIIRLKDIRYLLLNLSPG